MQPDAGESAASITRRSDNAGWAKIEPFLQNGCTLHRPKGLRTFYPHDGRNHVGGTGGLSVARVRQLENEGVLINIGADRYSLAKASGATA